MSTNTLGGRPYGADSPAQSEQPSKSADPGSSVRNIPGWGSDLPHSERPAVPMERTPPRLEENQQILPEKQAQRVEVLRSKEHFRTPPLHGSTLPPYGVNGTIRRLAFKFSENDIRHWLMLLFADRVDMVEALVADIVDGKCPNLWAETGMPAQWKHDRGRVLRKAALLCGAAALTYAFMKRKTR